MSQTALVFGFTDMKNPVGNVSRVLEVETQMKERRLIKRRGVFGWNPGRDNNVTILNRSIELRDGTNDRCVSSSQDSRHVDLVTAEAGLDNPRAKGVTTLAIKDDNSGNDEPPSREKASAFRSTCLRVSFLAVFFATCVACKRRSRLVDAKPNPEGGTEDQTNRDVLGITTSMCSNFSGPT